jgi:hypothetical protein
MYASGHESTRWACPLCVPGWRPGPNDPPAEEMMAARNCTWTPGEGLGLDLPYAPEATRCPRRVAPQALPLILAWRMWKDTGALPAGVTRLEDLPVRMVEAFQTIEIAWSTARPASTSTPDVAPFASWPTRSGPA